MSTKTILFGERAAGVYLLTEIYDPDKDGTDISASGKIVPAIGSQIVDNTKGLHNQLYTVTSVDDKTYKVTMVPSTYVVDSTAQVDRVLSYGNDIFMLYFSPTVITIGSNKVQVNRLIVDNKLSLFGNYAATYQLTMLDKAGKEVIISRWYDASGVSKGTSIPMLETGVEGIRKCDGCYTENLDIEEGDVVTCNIYSSAGISIARIELIAKKAHFLNESISSANPIVDVEIDSNQILEDGTLFVYQNQNIEELTIYVKLHYSDGNVRSIAVDNKKCFVYGIDEIRNDIVNTESTITLKYYLSNTDVMSDTSFVYGLTTDTKFQEDVTYYKRVAAGNRWEYIEATVEPGADIEPDTYYTRSEVGLVVDSQNDIRFISKTATVKVVNRTQDEIGKISIIPIWTADETNGNHWTIACAKYRKNRTGYSGREFEVSVTDDDGKPLDTWQMGIWQNIKLVTTQVVDGAEVPYTQNASIYLADPSKLTAADNTRWLIADVYGANIVYGDNTIPHKRPRILKATNTITGATTYTIPSVVFAPNTSQTAVDVFLENFYYAANPPKLQNESLPPKPTHFIVKDSSGASLMRDRVAIEQYNDNGVLVPTFSMDLGFLKEVAVGSTLIVEFYRVTETGVIEILYGVPVDCVDK